MTSSKSLDIGKPFLRAIGEEPNLAQLKKGQRLKSRKMKIFIKSWKLRKTNNNKKSPPIEFL